MDEEEEGRRRWSDLPKDLLELILRRLDIVDYLRFGWVCTKWRSVVIGGYVPSPRHPPWLVMDYKSVSYIQRVELNCYDFLKGRSVGLNIPNEGEWKCCGSSHGWLILDTDKGYRVRLLNPISMQQIHLPPNGIKGGFNDADKAVISSPPHPYLGLGLGLGDDHHRISVVLLLFHSVKLSLKSCIVGDEEWSTELSDIKYDGMIQDFIFYKGLLYVLVAKDESLVTIYRFDHPTRPTKEKILSFYFQMRVFVWNYYLVESGGELILVGQTIDQEFLVYKLDEDGLRWGEIKGLDVNHTLFLGKRGSVSISSQDSIDLGLKNNSVYIDSGGNYTKNYPLRYFSMEHGFIRSFPHHPPHIYGCKRSSCWFMPTAPPKTLS